MPSNRPNAHLSAELVGYESGHNAPLRATAAALDAARTARSIVLVEGISDQVAVEALARRLGCDLSGTGTVVVPIGGAHSTAHHLELFAGRDVRIAGLCDRNEHPHVAAAFVAAGRDATDLFVCGADLEDELIRAVGEDRLVEVMSARGEAASFRTMGKQSAWKGRPFEERAHRWIRSHARRSSVYAGVLIDVIDDERLPAPLLSLLDRATTPIVPGTL